MTDAILPPAPSIPQAPSLFARYSAMLYESLLLFGVVFVSVLIYRVTTQSTNQSAIRLAVQLLGFFVPALYFSWFWTHGGQTLAMQTWHIRLTERDGGPLTVTRALCRYLLLWMFILPTLGALDALSIGGPWALAAIGLALVLPPLWALVDRDRQFLHDRMLGTRLIKAPKIERRTASTKA